MMKKFIFILMTITMFALVGCGKDTDNSADETETSGIEETTEVAAENDENTTVINKVDDSKTLEDTINGTAEAGTAGGPKVLNYGTVEESSFLQFSIERAGIERAIYPSDTSSVYTYQAEQDGQEYFYLTGTMKNISGNSYDVENISAEFCFDNKYNYSGWLIADDGGNDFYDSTVTPLSTIKYYIYTLIPNELVNTYKTCTVKFGMKENFSGSYLDDLDECDYVYQITVNK